MRGMACIALDNPKDSSNVGGCHRAAHIFGAKMLVVSGRRFRKMPTDTTKAYRHIPVFEMDDVFDAIPRACIPVAVDRLDGAIELQRYIHPESAFYIFGAEDATLGKRIIDRCRDVIIIPTAYCLNLAACVNVVLYDRLAKTLAN